MTAVTVPIATSYFQYDQQGVVFNMWYFGWFDDAMPSAPARAWC